MSDKDATGLDVPTIRDLIEEKAAEIKKRAPETASPTTTSGNLTSEAFWAEYKRIEVEQGHEAKNVWYAKNKHRKPATTT